MLLPSGDSAALWAHHGYSGRAEALGKSADEASLRSVGQLGLVLCVWCTPGVEAEHWAAAQHSLPCAA